MNNNEFNEGDEIECVSTEMLPGNDVAPALEFGKKYKVVGICLDAKGNQHLNVGLPSSLNFVRSYETKEQLPDGNKIHWCHPSRFKKVA